MVEDYVCLIPLRAGSKGLVQKNLLPLNGLPLYMHTLQQALRIIPEVFISTDIPEIASRKPRNYKVIQRPSRLATDDTPMSSVISHFIEFEQVQNKNIVLLQATSPLRLDKDIIKSIILHSKLTFDTVLTVTKTSSTILKTGFLSGDTFTPVSGGEYCFSNRQQLPKVVQPNGAVYVFSAKSFLLSGSKIPTSSIGAVQMPVNRSLDIDSMEDLKKANKFLTSQK